jgi:hypothetical protein
MTEKWHFAGFPLNDDTGPTTIDDTDRDPSKKIGSIPIDGHAMVTCLNDHADYELFVKK